MIKNLIAALAVLSFLPSVSVAVEANLDKAPTSTLTYTIRAKDTSPTDILSMGGAASCSVTAQLASGSVSVVPRADASVAHSTGTAGTVTLSASGTGTLTSAAGQFSVSFTAVGKSIVTVACTPGGGGGGGASELVDLTDVPAKVLADGDKYLEADASGVLTWVSEPAKDPLLEAYVVRVDPNATASTCLRLDGVASTNHSPFMRPESTIACSNTVTGRTVVLSNTITSMTLTVAANTNNVAGVGQALTSGCSVCVTTDDATCEAGTKVNLPSSSGGDQFVAGTTSTVAMSYTPSPTTPFKLLVLPGDFNFNGAGGSCQFGQALFHLRVDGTIN